MRVRTALRRYRLGGLKATAFAALTMVPCTTPPGDAWKCPAKKVTTACKSDFKYIHSSSATASCGSGWENPIKQTADFRSLVGSITPIRKMRPGPFLSMPVYYELLNDNLHDVSHVEFVHPETLGTTVIPQMYRMAESEFTERCFARKNLAAREMHLEFHAEDIQGGPVLHQMIAFQRTPN
jgi:hypothetical protein